MTDLKIIRGDDETLTILVTDPDSVPIPNAPVDLTGAELTWIMKRRPTDADADALLTKTTPGVSLPGGITLSNQTTDTGEAIVDIDDSDTDDLAPGVPYWELQSVDATGQVHTLASGRIRILADLVRTT